MSYYLGYPRSGLRRATFTCSIFSLIKRKAWIYPLFRYPKYTTLKIIIFLNNYNIYMDKVSVYYLDPLYFWCDPLLLKTSALLRDLQKMAASKPIS
jgi:hypothetical protein